MSITPIGPNAPAPREPERTKVNRADSGKKGARLGSEEAVKTRGLVSEIGARMAEIEEQAEKVDERVAEALEELRRGTLLDRRNRQQAAENMLFGEDPEALPPG